MDLALTVSPVVLAASAVGAGVLAWWAYGRSTPAVVGWRRVALAALRWTALFVVLLLLVDPVWRRVTRTAEPPLLAVLVDDSESLRLGTAGPAPDAQVRGALDGLPDDAALRFYRFTGDAEPAGTDLAGADLAFRGERTDIAGALARVEADFAGRNLRGVVLISDGRITDGRNPAYLAERFSVPIYAAVAGDSVSSRDVRLERAITNDIAYVGSPLPIQAGVRASGYAGEAAAVTVTSGGRPLASQSVTLLADGAEAVADLEVTPTSTGVRRYTVAVGPLPGEATTRNNRRTVTVRVIDDSRRVLLVAAGPSPDVAALRATLEADRSLDVTVRTQRSPGQFYEGALPNELGRFDVLVLAGYPGRASDPAQAARLGAAVAAGLPVVFVATAGTDLARLGAAFGDVLPARPEAARPGTVPVSLAPTAAGQAHPLLDLGVPPDRLLALPPLQATPSRWGLEPGARVLATVRRGGTVLDVPLLVVRQAGTVRSAALLGAGSWRWRTLPDDLDDLRGTYATLVDRMVRWTTATRDRRPVRVRPDLALFGERDRVTFSGQVYGDNLTPVSDARVEVSVRGPGGAATVTMRALGNGRYAADLGIRPAGRYAFTAVATSGGARLGQDQGAFSVGRLSAEFREPGADPALMRQLATRSGGRVVGLDTLGTFVSGLRERGALADRPLVREDETPLLDLWWLLALAVALLAAEWVWRKRLGMV